MSLNHAYVQNMCSIHTNTDRYCSTCMHVRSCTYVFNCTKRILPHTCTNSKNRFTITHIESYNYVFVHVHTNTHRHSLTNAMRCIHGVCEIVFRNNHPMVYLYDFLQSRRLAWPVGAALSSNSEGRRCEGVAWHDILHPSLVEHCAPPFAPHTAPSSRHHTLPTASKDCIDK